jgi:putative ABC transport system permease protein
MIRNYLKITLRSLVKNKVYSFINIAGLATGMAVAMLIGLWIYDEISFNKYHKNYERIAKVETFSTNPNTGVEESSVAVQLPLGAEVKKLYGNLFDHVLMAFWISNYTLSNSDKKFPKTGEFIEGEVIDMLSLKMLQGTNLALKEPNSIIL